MKVIKKQTNSKMCVVCGIDNKFGINAPFYEMEDKTVVSIFKYNENQQSYPGRVHGGLISSMIDEIIGRAIWIYEPLTWGVTIELNIRYRKPVPYDKELKAVGMITKNTKRTFEGNGYIYDLDGNLLAEGTAIYFKSPLNVIANDGNEDDVNILVEDDVKEI